MKQITNANIVIVGGGVIALSIAYELLSSGKKITVIFPKKFDSESASRAAGAMLGAFGEVTADDGDAEVKELDFRITAQRLYPQWLQEIKDRSGVNLFQGLGTYIIANNDGVCDRASIHRIKHEADRYNEPAEWVEPEQVPGLQPNTTHAPSLCLFLSNEHSIDSVQLLDALTQIVCQHTNSSYFNETVTAIKQQNDQWIIATKEATTFLADEVVLAAGSRSLQMLADETIAEAKIPNMYFGKGVSVLVRGLDDVTSTIRTPNRAFSCGIHVVPRAKPGITYVGATNFMGVDHDAEQGVQPAELHALFEDTIHQINTDIRVSRIEEIRVGYRPIMTNRKPAIGKTKLPGLYIATGTYRNGVLMAPLIAKIIGQEIRDSHNIDQIENPYSVFTDSNDCFKPIDWERLTKSGIRDIIRFIQEPHSPLPYNRAAELEKYIKVLFELAVRDDVSHDIIRTKIRDQLQSAPFNETMHKLYYDIISHAE